MLGRGDVKSMCVNIVCSSSCKMKKTFKSYTVLTKENTVLTKVNKLLTKENTVLTKVKKILTKENTVLTKVNKMLTKEN